MALLEAEFQGPMLSQQMCFLLFVTEKLDYFLIKKEMLGGERIKITWKNKNMVLFYLNNE